MPQHYTFKLRRGPSVEWTGDNPVLAAGEPGVEIDTHRMKIGDGVSRWQTLPYLGGGNVFTQDTDPGNVPDGSIWYVTSAAPSGPLGSGLRAAPNTVGYLGEPHSSARTLNIGDTIPSEFTGCTWDSTVLRVNSSDLVIDNWQINAGVDCYGTNLTITNSVILPPVSSAFYGVLLRHGNLTIEDTTITGAGTSFEQGQNISNDDLAGSIFATRCEFGGGFQDAIGIIHGTISQCWVHDIALAGSFHSDGIQVFGHANNNVAIEHCYLNITGPSGQSTNDIHQNACVYTDLPTGPANGITVNNCYLVGGAYELMLSADPQGVVVTNCDFGLVDSHGLGEVTATPGTAISSWSNNHDSNGNLIPNPVP